MKQTVVISLLCLAFFSCKKTENEPVDIGLNYHPNQTGHFKIYKVDSIVFNDFTLETDT